MSEEKKTLTEDEIKERLARLFTEHKLLKDEFAVVLSEYGEALGEINRQFDARRIPVEMAIGRVMNQIAEVRYLCPRHPHKPVTGYRYMQFLFTCPICGAKPDQERRQAMSMLDESTLCKMRCPDCGGKVYRDYFSGDCRGNPPVTTIWCKKCKKEFTEKEWAEIEKTAKEKNRKKLLPKDVLLEEAEDSLLEIVENDRLSKSRSGVTPDEPDRLQALAISSMIRAVEAERGFPFSEDKPKKKSEKIYLKGRKKKSMVPRQKKPRRRLRKTK